MCCVPIHLNFSASLFDKRKQEKGSQGRLFDGGYFAQSRKGLSFVLHVTCMNNESSQKFNSVNKERKLMVCEFCEGYGNIRICTNIWNLKALKSHYVLHVKCCHKLGPFINLMKESKLESLIIKHLSLFIPQLSKEDLN